MYTLKVDTITPHSTFRITDLVLIVLLSASVFYFAHYAAFCNPFLINDDVRQQVAWMYQWRDPSLFIGDYLVDFARHYVAWGVQGIYRVISLFIDPIIISKILTGLLFVWLGLMVFLLGYKLGGWQIGYTVTAIFWCSPYFLQEMSGGLSRSFAPPLLAQFAWAMLTNRSRTAATTILLQALCIPYIFVLSATSVTLGWFSWRIRLLSKPTLGDCWWHWLVIVLGGGLVLAFNYALNVAGYGPLVDETDIIGQDEFSKTGRLKIIPIPSFLNEICTPWEHILPFRDGGVVLGILVSLALIVSIIIAWKYIPWRKIGHSIRPLIPIAIASLLLHILARLILFKLFVPSRYIEYSINISYTLLLGIVLAPIVTLIGLTTSRTLATIFLFAATVFGGLRLHNAGLYDYSAERLLYEYITQLPKNVLIAGHPYLMDNVFAFGHRRAFITFELAHPWCKGLWKTLKPRIEDFFHAYYAKDASTVHQFCHKYHIDFFIVDQRHFKPEFIFNNDKAYNTLLLCDAIPNSDTLKRLCHSIGLTWRVVLPPTWERFYPAHPPFFAPFDRLIYRLALNSTFRFILLDENSFPAIHINPSQRLIDVRSLHRLSCY